MVKQSDERLDVVFHALADGSRRKMLHRLADSDRTIGELAHPFEMSLAAVSKHVKSLERAGLVRRSVHGRTHVIHLNPRPMALAQKFLRFYERLWNDQFDKLDQFLKQQDKEGR
jgi:DNA-binding transcriptional ArsR family regulator